MRSTSVLFVAVTLHSGVVLAQQRPRPVEVVNTPAVTISGTPTVDVVNTPAVTISGTPTVNVGNSPAVTISGTPTVRAQQSGDWSVEVTNLPPAAVEPARETFHAMLERSTSEPSSEVRISFPEIPAGKRLVIQHVSGFVQLDGSTGSYAFYPMVHTYVGGRPAEVMLELRKEAESESGILYYSFAGTMPIYADPSIGPGAPNQFSVLISPVHTARARVSIWGFLVDCTASPCHSHGLNIPQWDLP